MIAFVHTIGLGEDRNFVAQTPGTFQYAALISFTGIIVTPSEAVFLMACSHAWNNLKSCLNHYATYLRIPTSWPFPVYETPYLCPK